MGKQVLWKVLININRCLIPLITKNETIGRQHTEPYKGGAAGVDVQWVFEGMPVVLPIYEDIAVGSESMWCERTPRRLKNLRKMAHQQKHEFHQ